MRSWAVVLLSLAVCIGSALAVGVPGTVQLLYLLVNGSAPPALAHPVSDGFFSVEGGTLLALNYSTLFCGLHPYGCGQQGCVLAGYAGRVGAVDPFDGVVLIVYWLAPQPGPSGEMTTTSLGLAAVYEYGGGYYAVPLTNHSVVASSIATNNTIVFNAGIAMDVLLLGEGLNATGYYLLLSAAPAGWPPEECDLVEPVSGAYVSEVFKELGSKTSIVYMNGTWLVAHSVYGSVDTGYKLVVETTYAGRTFNLMSYTVTEAGYINATIAFTVVAR